VRGPLTSASVPLWPRRKKRANAPILDLYANICGDDVLRNPGHCRTRGGPARRRGRASGHGAPVLVDVQVTPDTVAVSGLNLVPVTVSVHLTDESGVRETGTFESPGTPFVRLAPVDVPEFDTDKVELALTSGTAQDGVWSATVQVPSTWDGRREVQQVRASDMETNTLDVDPRTASIRAGLTVTGTHRPALTMGFQPDPVVGNARRITVVGRAYFTDTGEGIPNLGLFIGVDRECEDSPRTRTVTNARGEYSVPGRLDVVTCVGILRPSNIEGRPAFITSITGLPRVKLVVTATADRTSVRLGSAVVIRGSVAPFGNSAHLQRLDGGVWRTLRTRPVSDAGSFRLADTPSQTGTYRYRVVVPSRVDDALSGVSATIVVEVTEGGVLPVTGPSLAGLVLVALALIAVGGALVLTVRRRRVTSP
jgi:hypothetical protein